MFALKNLQGLISIIGGVYAILLARGVLPRNTQKPHEWVAWRGQFGGTLRVVGPILIVFGLAQLFGDF